LLHALAYNLTPRSEKGVKFVLGEGSIKEFKAGRAGAVGSALLENGNTLPCDVCIMATGVKPSTQFLSDAFDVQKDGGLDVDQSMRVKGESDIYAVGDIARFQHPGAETFGRIEHWNVAQNRACRL
jgi:NADPH-dependent 2,4-dienoyl-CoA reductase/sulfur reductase-like enzyme